MFKNLNLKIVRLRGGIGNQLFQYAFAKKLEYYSNENIVFDISDFYVNKHHSGFMLDQLVHDIHTTNTNSFLSSPNSAYSRILRKLHFNNKFIYYEKSIGYDDMSYKSSKSYFDGYWQSHSYFHGIEEILKASIKFSPTLESKFVNLIREISDCTSVSVHVRRGDYLIAKNLNIYESVGVNYYKEVLSLLIKMFGRIRIYIFTDDTKWVRENFNFIDQEIVIVSEMTNSAIEDLYLMQLCKINVIANSSFSWWAAYLNKNVHKIVYMPSKWYKNLSTPVDLIPSNWITV